MNKIMISLAISLTVAMAQATVIRPVVNVTSAVLYLNGAEVTREADIVLPEAGVYTVEIPALDNAQEQVQLTGATLQSQSTLPALAPDATELANKKSRLETVKTTLAQNATLIQQLLESVKEHPETYDTMQTHLQTLRQENNELRSEQAQLQTEITQLSQAGDGAGKTQIYQIVAEQAGTAHLTLRHFGDDADWQPSAIINLKTGDNQVDFTAFAEVHQHRGDWHDVKLTLALTPPNDAPLPRLESTQVSAVMPSNQPRVLADMAVNRVTLMGELGASPMMAKAVASAPQILTNGVDFRIELPNTYTLKQNASTRLPYYRTQATADMTTAVYGWAGEQPLLLAQWTQPKVLPFLAGEADIQRDGLSIGQRYYREFWQAGDKKQLSFGVDPAFVVKITTPPGYTDKTGVFDKRKVEQQRHRVSIQNVGNATRKVAFYARVPQAGNSDTEVKTVFSQKPSLQNTEGVAGIYRWDIGKLSADKTWTLDYGYDVSYPEAMQLQ